LQYGYAQNEAIALAAAGLDVEDSVSKRKVERVRVGEIAHLSGSGPWCGS
jgi:hypothetical protein